MSYVACTLSQYWLDPLFDKLLFPDCHRYTSYPLLSVLNDLVASRYLDDRDTFQGLLKFVLVMKRTGDFDDGRVNGSL